MGISGSNVKVTTSWRANDSTMKKSIDTNLQLVCVKERGRQKYHLSLQPLHPSFLYVSLTHLHKYTRARAGTHRRALAHPCAYHINYLVKPDAV